MTTTDCCGAARCPELEHRRQLRRAVIASTIGTTIEWYDFFIYGTVTGLVFAKLYFPGSDPLVGTLQAFAIYAVGFVARPVGAAIFGHYGDRIGRKAALIATLLLMGIATFLVAFVPGYAQDRHLGCGDPDGPAHRAGDRRRRRMGRLGADVDGMGADQRPSRLYRLVAAIRRAVRAVSGEPGGAGVQRDLRPAVHHLGLAHPVHPQHRPGRDRPLYPARHPRDPGLFAARRRRPRRARAGARSHQAPAARDHPDRAGADGRAGAVLHLHRLCLHLWDDGPAQLARSAADRGAGRLGRVVLYDPVSPATCPTGSAASACT